MFKSCSRFESSRKSSSRKKADPVRTAWCKINSVSQAEVSTSTDVSRAEGTIKNYYSQRDKVI